MPYQRTYDHPELVTLPPCLYLRNKLIYVTGEIDPKELQELGHHSHCWCNQTQHVIGPDDNLVDRSSCVAGRSCYRER
jgi:hypothetical protein